MNNIFDALQTCLQELENGADIETVLARFPDLSGELRPILKASINARMRSDAVTNPSPEVIRRGRTRVMQRAAEMRESTVAKRKRGIPAFQKLAISFSLAALLLLSGTGLVNASSSALPGESLYPVKRTWEGLRLFLIFNEEAREHLEDQFENERLHEVNELLVEGRHEVIQFAGIFMQVNGITYVSGVQVVLPAEIQLPANGAAVILSGRTNAQGFVEIITLELLPDGSVVPVGNPVEVDLESDPESSSGPDTETPETGPRDYAMEGTLESVSTATLVINGLVVYLDNAQVDGELCPGIIVRAEGYTTEDGRFIVTEVKAKGSCPSGDDNGNSNLNSNTNDSSESDDNADNGNDNDSDSNDSDSNDNKDDDGKDDSSGGGDDNDDD